MGALGLLILVRLALLGHTSLIWLDCDPSVGQHEVDDGYALLQGFKSHSTTVVGVSAIFGNAPLSVTHSTAQKIVDALSNGTMRVFGGATSSDDYGTSTDASVAIAAALSYWCNEKIIIIALGPLTNIAAALASNASIAHCVREIISVSGRRPRQKFSVSNSSNFLPDLNFDLDPRSYSAVMNSTVALTLIPWEAASKVWLLRSDLADIMSTDPFVQWLVESSLQWCTHWQNRFGVDGFNPFDSLAVGYVTTPSAFTCENLRIVMSCGDSNGVNPLHYGGICELELHVLEWITYELYSHVDAEGILPAVQESLDTVEDDRSDPLARSVTYCHSVHEGYSRALLNIIRGYSTIIAVDKV